MACSRRTRAGVFGCVVTLLLFAACTEDFSRFKFGKKAATSRDAGTENVSNRAGNSGQSRVDAGTAQSSLQPKAGAGGKGGAGTGPHAGDSADGQDLSDRDD